MPPDRESPRPCLPHGQGELEQRQQAHGTNPVQPPQLRQYQSDLIARTWAAIAAGQRRPLVVLPTGAGKAVIAGAMVRDAARSGKRVLALAHRRELIAHLSRKLHDAGVDHGIVAAEFPSRPGERVQVASIATLHARAIRSSRIEAPPAELIVVDEGHHISARSYRQILKLYPDAIVIGFTATPCRGDGRGLGNAFDVLIEGPSAEELIKGGFLVPTRVYAPSRPDLAGVQVARGDYVEAQLAARMDTGQLVGDVVTNWLHLGERRRTVVFASGVAHSVHLANEFRRAGVMAEHIDGGTPVAERDATLKRLAEGAIDVVCNAAVLTEGWDCPSAACLVLARPTRSLGLYRQMVGRVLRPAPGKSDALILDHAAAVFAHGFAEESVTWTLHAEKRAVNASQTRRAKHQAPQLIECPECKAVRFQGRPCPACGWRPKERAQAVDVVDGDLAAVDRNRKVAAAFDAQQRIRFYRMLLHIAGERGYARGWAAHKHREKFGEWPPRSFLSPLEPDDATRAWVKSRAIAYAKARAKERGDAA